jgi:UDP-3-O-[3-hydroxymyristoyl] glucosamine N-acyltransferase
VSPTSAKEIAAFLGVDSAFDDFEINGPCSIKNIRSFSVAFVTDFSKLSFLRNTCKYVLFLAADDSINLPFCQVIRVENPRLKFAQVVSKFFVDPEVDEIASTAICSRRATISDSATIGEYTVVEDGVTIGDHVRIGHHTVICKNTEIGDGSQIGSNSVIGSMGLGLARDEHGVPIRIPHLGNVRIGKEVEIGSCVTIARGTIDSTQINDMVKIDDHVFIAHNAQIGSRSILVAGCEISGSVEIGDDCWIGPLSTIRDGLTIGSKSIIGMGSVVTKNVEQETTVAGNPARKLG